jgi:tetratricopeptide (TPR) repeat protein
VEEDSVDELDLSYGDALSDLETDDEASDVFAMEGWDEDEDDEDDEDGDEDEGSDEKVDLSSNALEDLLEHPNKTVAAMATFYTELLQAGPLVPLALQRDDLSDYITLKLLRMRANRALGRWHPELHSQRSPEGQRAAKELYRLVQARLKSLSSIGSLAEAIAELRSRFGWPKTKAEDPSRAKAMHERALALAAEEAWEAVVVMSDKATAMAPNHPRYRALDLLARASLQEMSPLSAVVNLDALKPRDDDERAVLEYTAGRVWEQAKRPALALARYGRALSLAATHEDAARRAESLQESGAADADTTRLPSFFQRS